MLFLLVVGRMCFLDFVSNVWDLKLFYSEFQTSYKAAHEKTQPTGSAQVAAGLFHSNKSLGFNFNPCFSI